MSEQARFCTTCGTQHVEDARFCTSCGEQVVGMAAAAAPTESTPAPPSGESVQGIIPNATLKEGFLGVKSKPYILVLTERRIIFVHITKEMMKQLVTDARDGAKAEGKGFFGQWGAQLTAYTAFAQRYQAMPPEQALAEAPGNFAVERSAIVKTKLKAGSTDEEGHSTSDRLIIKATDRKYTLDLGSGMRQAKEALIAAALI